MIALTAAEMHALRTLVLSDGGSVCGLTDKLERMIAETSAVRQLGPKVFEWRLPLSITLARAHGIQPSILRWRLHQGWLIEEAICTPVQLGGISLRLSSHEHGRRVSAAIARRTSARSTT